MKSQFLSVQLEYIAHPDRPPLSAFAGRVVDSLDNWNDQYVIGLTGAQAEIAEGRLERQPINQVSVLPAEHGVDPARLVANLKPLCTALLCRWHDTRAGDYLHLRTEENETVAIVSDTWEAALPHVQWVLMKNAQAVVYVPRGDVRTINAQEDHEAALRAKWTRHAFFKHATFKTKFPKECQDLAKDVLKVTLNYGASALLVLEGARAAFGAEQVELHRQVLIGAGVNARVVWCTKLEQIDPCECECMFRKGLSLSFFNANAILETESHAGVVQHALVETLKHICNSSLFLAEDSANKFETAKPTE